MTQETKTPSLLKRRASRRAVLGAAVVGGGSLALAYEAMRDPLGLFGGSSSDTAATLAAARGDTDAIKQPSVQVSHLLRRAGFGATPEEYDHYQGLGVKGAVDELVSFTTVNDDAAVSLANQQAPIDSQNRAAPVAWWLIRMANTARPLQEKMTLFWHGLLTSQLSVVQDPPAMVAQNQLFRDHAFDTFPAILRAVTMDPAMMEYLNLAGSVKAAPNENYARELMELFSLGIGNYSETDVREAARAFTGWNVPRNRDPNGGVVLGTPVFRANQFDSGTKNFLGHSGNFRPEDIVGIITDQDASAAYITRRLFAFFVWPNPSDADIKPFVDVYQKNDKSVGAVVEALLRSDAFYSPQAYRAIVKSPVEYFIGALKAVGAPQQVLPLLAGPNRDALGNMGQTPMEPPNVAGWPGNAAWLNSATMFARLNFLNALTGGVQPPKARAGQAQAATPNLGAGLSTTSQALAHYLPLALDDNLPDASRQVLNDYADGPDATLSPEQLRGLVYLTLGAPQFHLA